MTEKRFVYRTAGFHVRSHIEETLECCAVGSHAQPHIGGTSEYYTGSHAPWHIGETMECYAAAAAAAAA